MSRTHALEPSGVDAVIDLFTSKGQGTYGEDVTQLDHALQSAAFAAARGWSDELVAACLLHDLGHLVVDQQDDPSVDLEADDDRHETVGARILARLFGSAVAVPVAMHVVAKRWRCATDPGYHATLSATSKSTLIAQGGPLDGDAVTRFEATAGFADAVSLREADDAAKVPGLEVPGLETYRDLLNRLVIR